MSTSYAEPLHPATGDSLSDLDRTLLRLRFVALEAQRCYRAIAKPVENVCQGSLTLSGDMEFVMGNHAALIVDKFLEVWKSMGSAARLDEMKRVRAAVEPFIERITQWPDLGQHRNSALAHPYLTRDNKFIHPTHHLLTSGAPSYTAEIVVLLYCAMFSIVAVLAQFQNEYTSLAPLLTAPPEPPAQRGIVAGTKIQEQIRPLAALVDQNLLALGLTLREPAFAEFRESLRTGLQA